MGICAIPKGGSTAIRALVGRLAGVLDPLTSNCEQWFEGIDVNGMVQGHAWNLFVGYQLEAAGWVDTYSSNVTNILMVRDPWTRAVSEYADQIKRGHYDSSPSNASEFLHFVRSFANKKYSHHTGAASNKCASQPDARFDHIIDIEDVSSFVKVARDVPILGEAANSGWEKCTSGEPSFYLAGSFSKHKTTPDLKHVLCNSETIKAVCDVYKEDYEIYGKFGKAFECSCMREVQTVGGGTGENSSMTKHQK